MLTANPTCPVCEVRKPAKATSFIENGSDHRSNVRSTSYLCTQSVTSNLCFLYRGQDPSEWGIVELQGQLDTKPGLKFDDLHIGDLHFDEKVIGLLRTLRCSARTLDFPISCRARHI